MSSKALGLNNYIKNHPKGSENHPNAKVKFRLGDVVTTNIMTSQSESILLTHDTNLSHPYSLGFRIQGKKGIWMDLNSSLYLEGISPPHRWESAKSYLGHRTHPMWKHLEKDAAGAD